MVQFKSIVSALVFTLVVCGASRGANIGDDQDPFPTFDDPFWNTNGQDMKFPLYDGKNFQVFRSLFFYASTNLQANHDIDSQNVLHGHWHCRDNFFYEENVYDKDYSGQANAYWDVVFQYRIQPLIDREHSASTRMNCFAWALRRFINRGTYNYWIDEANVIPRLGGPGEASAAFAADAYTVLQKDVTTSDVYLYADKKNTLMHATGVFSLNCGPPISMRLEWKYQASGVYTYILQPLTYNTPMYDFNGPEIPGRPLPAGRWVADGAGNQNQLKPPGKIWRAQAKQN